MSADYHIYLASSSPRRRELLSQLGVSFRVVHPELPEQPQPGEAPAAYVQRLALAKARAGLGLCADPAALVLGSDTSVVVDGAILGKPADAAEAAAMLLRLAGRSHQVLTAVALVDAGGRLEQRLSTSEVAFRRLTAAEAAAYWASGEPADKAGGYAIQGRGAMFVRHLGGSHSGVMGLPLYETAEMLQSFGVRLL